MILLWTLALKIKSDLENKILHKSHGITMESSWMLYKNVWTLNLISRRARETMEHINVCDKLDLSSKAPGYKRFAAGWRIINAMSCQNRWVTKQGSYLLTCLRWHAPPCRSRTDKKELNSGQSSYSFTEQHHIQVTSVAVQMDGVVPLLNTAVRSVSSTLDLSVRTKKAHA